MNDEDIVISIVDENQIDERINCILDYLGVYNFREALMILEAVKVHLYNQILLGDDRE